MFKQFGFTLIELMISIAIIGILAAIAANVYQHYTLKASLTTIYRETSNLRLPYQMLLNNGDGVNSYTPSGLNVSEYTRFCHFSIKPPNVNGLTNDAIRCDIYNIPSLSGEYLSINRTQDGDWVCHASSAISTYLPNECQ